MSKLLSAMSIADFAAAAPGVVDALRALGRTVEASGLETDLIELVKLRVSQINGCAYCVAFHLALARKLGVAHGKLDLLGGWRDAGEFGLRERAALGWAEHLTMMGGNGDRTAEGELCRHFTATEVSFLTSAIALINAWNRIAGGLHFTA